MKKNPTFSDLFKHEISQVDEFLDNYFQPEVFSMAQEMIGSLYESVNYSLLSGGKRFRPVLCLLTAKSLKAQASRVLAFAAAVEMIHTYSLIHDDLPLMDNDDERRGKPTNHKVFGEATALLAGDALLTEAFGLVARAFQDSPNVGLKLIALLSEASGAQGMVGGQALDVIVGHDKPQAKLSEVQLQWMHEFKTGALIRVAVEGAAWVCVKAEEQIPQWRNFGSLLGLSFQLADDLLDYNPASPESTGYPYIIGESETRSRLESVTVEAMSALKILNIENGPLVQMVQYNQSRSR